MKARRAGTRVIETAVDTTVTGTTTARVAVTRFHGAPAAVKARRGPTGVEELARITEVLVSADTDEFVGRHVDARTAVVTVGSGARTGLLTSLAVVPLRTYTPVSKLAGCIVCSRCL